MCEYDLTLNNLQDFAIETNHPLFDLILFSLSYIHT